ncbi:hypothetical protein QWI17_20390 [Gilvimarinus sp. SDUM040013]|uniref:Uncharacterized protein n=1 Tax=Gilvimarinus gilvus TaxID=3058038 RepID=A0ABU4RSA3_9GAMM|nr:hypothetical protein [Gilvimarinus sp. SDUM040013]MDO3388217.1 hypothetical protein [Gilvimarinus sp. SDUM040013]MDX6847767.1 hypothetical protein [Gilvimarinus sp. SDUM040013]
MVFVSVKALSIFGIRRMLMQDFTPAVAMLNGGPCQLGATRNAGVTAKWSVTVPSLKHINLPASLVAYKSLSDGTIALLYEN